MLLVPGIIVKIIFIRRFCQRFRLFTADYGVAGVAVQSVLLLQFTSDNPVADVRTGGFDTAGGEGKQTRLTGVLIYFTNNSGY